MVCSPLAVPLQVRERPLSSLGPRRAAGSAAAAVGPPVVPICVLLSLFSVSGLSGWWGPCRGRLASLDDELEDLGRIGYFEDPPAPAKGMALSRKVEGSIFEAALQG